MLIPPLHGALLKNEQDVHLFERWPSSAAVRFSAFDRWLHPSRRIVFAMLLRMRSHSSW
jgi:hypothetical protein